MEWEERGIVSVGSCESYQLEEVRSAVVAVLAPLGGMTRFVRPGMQVLLKPNLLLAADLARAVTTHPMVVQAVTELVEEAGGTVLIGDSPAGQIESDPPVWRKGGMTDVVARTDASLVLFKSVTWQRLNSNDYLIARPVLEADLVINLPKLKTHSLTLYTGAVKNLFGTIPGTRKREVHYRAPGLLDFSQALVDVLELVRPGLTIMDGVLGQEGNGPGVLGTPRRYGGLVASADPVALDAVITRAVGYRPGDVLHLAAAGARGLGESDPRAVQVKGDRAALEFGRVRLPRPRWYLRRIPAWLAGPVHRMSQVRPRLMPSVCESCGRCVEVCPRGAIVLAEHPHFDLKRCVGCLCCAEACPTGAIELHRSLLGRLIGL